MRTTKVALIFLPGVMGTRLRFTRPPMPVSSMAEASMLGAIKTFLQKDAIDWDLSADLAKWVAMPIQWQRTIFQDWQVAIAPPKPDDSFDWSTLLGGEYGSLLTYLKAELNRSLKYDSVVYAVGYVWTMSNRASAARVAARIAEIRRLESPDVVIIVTHSMGGLVARAAEALHPKVIGKIDGMIHVAQPAAGASKTYRQFGTGSKSPLGWVAYATDIIIGDEWWKYLALMSVLPSVLELLPTNAYALGDPSRVRYAIPRMGEQFSWTATELMQNGAPGQWLYPFRSKGGAVTLDPVATNIYSEYAKSIFPGICFDYTADVSKGTTRYHRFDRTEWGEVIQDLRDNLRVAESFHKAMAGQQSATTTWVANAQFPATDVGVVGFTNEDTTTFSRFSILGPGDVTVPLNSAESLVAQDDGVPIKDPRRASSGGVRPAAALTLSASDSLSEHQKMCGSTSVQRFVVDNAKYIVNRFLARAGVPPIQQGTTPVAQP